jgi:membrane protein DedA with SNARE-associated domain
MNVANVGIGHTIILFYINHRYLVYGFILILGIIEGPILSITLGILLRIGYFSFLPIYIVLVISDLIGDVILYTIGYFYGFKSVLKLGKWFGLTEKHIEKVQIMFKRHHEKILFTSKLTGGFGFSVATILTAGISKIPFFRFISINGLGQLIWTGLLLIIGYFFGSFYMSIPSIVGKIIFITLIIVLSLIIFYFNYKKNKNKKINTIHL